MQTESSSALSGVLRDARMAFADVFGSNKIDADQELTLEVLFERLCALACVVGVNRVGVDGNDLAYAGDSAALDFVGARLVELGAQEQVVTMTLDPSSLAAHRERFPAWMDADDFELKV